MQMENKQKTCAFAKVLYSSFQPRLSLPTKNTGNERRIMKA